MDATPLIERKETMVVQDLSDEADIFMEFSHLSASTRKKIEDFRRRRKEAERYIAEVSPALKRGRLTSGSKTSLRDGSRDKFTVRESGHRYGPKKSTSKRTSSKNVVHPIPKPTADEVPSPIVFDDPLARLKSLEARLQGRGMKDDDLKDKSLQAAMNQEEPMETGTVEFIQPIARFRRRSKTPLETEPQKVSKDESPEPYTRTRGQRPLVLSSGQGGHVISRSPEKDIPTQETKIPSTPVVENQRPSFLDQRKTPEAKLFSSPALTHQRPAFLDRQQISETKHAGSPIIETQRPTFTNLQERQFSDMEKKLASIRAANEEIKNIERATAASRVDTQSLNVLVNQLLEEQDRGRVSEELIQKIKNSPKFATSPFVQELMQGVLETQEAKKRTLQQQKQRDIEKLKQTAIVRPTTLHMSNENFNYTITPHDAENKVEEKKVEVAAVIVPPLIDAALPDLVQPQATPAGSPRMHDVGDANVRMTMDKLESPVGDQPDLVATSRAGSCEQLDLTGDENLKFAEAEGGEEEEEDEDMDDETDEGSDDEDGSEEDDDEEVDVHSTDYEDLDIDDDEHSSEGMPSISQPLSQDTEVTDAEAEDSFHSAHSQLNPEIQNMNAAFDRCLTKRQSRGKYEKSLYAYGREISIEKTPEPQKDWPQVTIGGVQPTIDIAPTLFTKAKQYILQYPNAVPDSPKELAVPTSDRKMHWLKTQDPDMGSSQERDSPARTLHHIPSQRSTGFPVQESPSQTEILQSPSETQPSQNKGQFYRVLWPPQSPNDETSLAPPAGQNMKAEFKLQAPPLRRRSRTASQASSGISNPSTPSALDSYVSTAVVSLQSPLDPYVESNRPRIKTPDKKDLSPPRVFTFTPTSSMDQKSPSPTDISRDRDLSLCDGVTAAFIRRKRLSQEKRKRNRSAGYTPEESLFNTAAEILQKPLTEHDDKSYSKERLDALLSPRASVQYEIPTERADPRRFSYRSAIEQSGTPAYSVRQNPYESVAQDISNSNSSGDPSSPLSPYGRGQPAIRPRYKNDIYRSHMDSKSSEALEPESFDGPTASRLKYEQRRKSRSLHELSPSKNGPEVLVSTIPVRPSYVPRYGYDRNIWEPGM